MVLGSRASSLRCAVVWSLTTAAAGLVVIGLAPEVTAARSGMLGHRVGDPSFDQVLVWSCALLGIPVTGWLWLAATLVVWDAFRGRETSRGGVPRALRTLVLVLCGATMTTALAGPATALGPSPGGPANPAVAPTGARTPAASNDEQLPGVLTGLRLPEPPSVPALRAPTPHAHPDGAAPTAPAVPAVARPSPAARPAVARGNSVVVRPGDSLWSLAARRLGPSCDEADVARAWPRIYALNRDVVGPDPDLLLPGQRLELPTTTPTQQGDRP